MKHLVPFLTGLVFALTLVWLIAEALGSFLRVPT